MNVHEKTEYRNLKKFKSRLNPHDYAIWCVFENKTNGTSGTNSGFFKIAIEEEWNKMSEKIILKTFRRRINTLIEENGGHIE